MNGSSELIWGTQEVCDEDGFYWVEFKTSGIPPEVQRLYKGQALRSFKRTAGPIQMSLPREPGTDE